MNRVVAEDRPAFEELYRLTSAKLFGVCHRILPERAEAEEALQETYLIAWRRAASFDPTRGAAITWLITIARNCSIDRIRSGGKRVLAPIDLAEAVPDQAASAWDVLRQDEEARALARCLNALEARDMRLITAAFYEGSTYSALAERSDTPLGTIKSRIRRALLSLRECLE